MSGYVTIPTPVRGLLVDDITDDSAPAGAFRFYRYGDESADGPPAGLNFRCPCGCGAVAGVRFRPHSSQPTAACWTWDGNREEPTIAPSIDHIGHWHGWLQGGLFKQA